MQDMDIIRSHSSPNRDARAGGRAIDMLVLHYTGMATGEAALQRLCDPAAKVSAHYLIEEDGRVFSLVPEDLRAWHAGVSSWRGAGDINSCSIGIELVNPGHAYPGYAGGYRPFPEAQMLALVALSKAIVARHGIPAARVLGHSDIAPARKTDPGELFDWRRLATAGVGVWPRLRAEPQLMETLSLDDRGPEVQAMKARLQGYGYGIAVSDIFDEETRLVVEAFQRHFRPSGVTGAADAETRAILAALAALA